MYRVNFKWLYLLPPSEEGTTGTVIPGWQNIEITLLYHSNSMKTSRNAHVLQKKQALRAIEARSAPLELNQYLSTVGLHQKCHVWHEPFDLQESLLTSKLKKTIQVVSFCLSMALPALSPPFAALILFFCCPLAYGCQLHCTIHHTAPHW